MTYLKSSFLGMFLLAHGLQAQSHSDYPVLSSKEWTIEAIIPLGWQLLSEARGDLNGDGIEDIAFAVQGPVPKIVEYHDGYESDTLHANPRILGIYFGKGNGEIKKVLQSNTFLINRSTPAMDEPFKGLQILPSGELQISFYIWPCRDCSTWSFFEYLFTYQNEAFELVEFEQVDTQRVSGEETSYSLEFRTGTMCIQTSGTEEEETENQLIQFELTPLQTIQSLGAPFQWLFQNLHI